jgi:hypothetical protein
MAECGSLDDGIEACLHPETVVHSIGAHIA